MMASTDELFAAFYELERLEAAASSARWALYKSAPDIFRQARSDLGLSQRELAQALEVSQSIIGRIEQGKTAPGRPLLKKLRALHQEKYRG